MDYEYLGERMIIIGEDDGMDFLHLDSMASAMLQNDIKNVASSNTDRCGFRNSNVEDKNACMPLECMHAIVDDGRSIVEDATVCLPLEFVHEIVSAGPCLQSLPAYRNDFIPPTPKVEVVFDGETNTIMSSGSEESYDRVVKSKRRSQGRTLKEALKVFKCVSMRDKLG
jgi:hypothetical protein